MISARRRGDTIIVEVDGRRVELTVPQAYVLVRMLAGVLELRVSLGKPIVTLRREPGAVHVTLMEGGGVRQFTVPDRLLRAYITALSRLGPGRHRYPVLARALLEEAGKAGFEDRVSRYLAGDPEEGWERLFGARADYYELFRVPLLVLEEWGCVEGKRRYVVVKECRPPKPRA